MLDIKFVRENTDKVIEALGKRAEDTEILDGFLRIDNERRDVLRVVEDMRKARNKLSQEIGYLKKQGKDASGLLSDAKAIADQITGKEDTLRELEDRAMQELLLIPNIPDESVPAGRDETENKVIRTWGAKPEFSFTPKNHWDIGEGLGILDFERAGKIAGARFVINKGAGARLERALMNFMLNLHTKEHGYTEILPPILVNRASMTGTGQLPKFEDDLFKLEEDSKDFCLFRPQRCLLPIFIARRYSKMMICRFIIRRTPPASGGRPVHTAKTQGDLSGSTSSIKSSLSGL